MNNKEYKCNICNKYYNSYQSLWNHNKKFHTKIEKNYKCTYCSNTYKHQSNKLRHEKTCILNPHFINKKIKDDNNDNIIKENKELKKIISNMQAIIDNKNVSIITNNNNTTNNNTTNNNTLNNINNVYVKFDNVSYEKILTKKEILEILNKKFMAIEESIKKIHFHPDREEYHNVYINNLEGKFGYVYDGGDKFIAMNKDVLLNELIDTHVCEIAPKGET